MSWKKMQVLNKNVSKYNKTLKDISAQQLHEESNMLVWWTARTPHSAQQPHTELALVIFYNSDFETATKLRDHTNLHIMGLVGLWDNPVLAWCSFGISSDCCEHETSFSQKKISQTSLPRLKLSVLAWGTTFSAQLLSTSSPCKHKCSSMLQVQIS